MKQLRLFKQFSFIFICFVALFCSKTALAATISFESHGGPSVASYDISTDTLGTLPSPTMDGYLFDGWYKESDYQNKVSSNTVVTGDMTLHAKWVSNPFAYVYPRHTESLVCDGATYVDTGVMLYNYDPVTGTGNWDKDYEIGFTIEEYDYNSQTTEQAVFMNTKYENQAAGWPGLVVRKSAQKIEITQTTDSGKVQRYISNLTFPMDVKIIRKNKTVYYQVNGGTLYNVQNMSNFTKYFDIPVYFCAGDDGNGGVQRYLVGTISNYYVKMGTYEDVVNYFVVYPNATVEIIEKNTVLDLGPNEEPKASENISKVTFNYNDGVTADTENYVKRVYTPNGYMIDGVHYDDGAKLVVDNNRTITYSYTDSIAGVEFPENPTRSHYIFTGWYDDPDNGNLVENYDGLSDITLYAHWEMNLPTSVEVDEDDLHMVTGDVHQVELTFSPDDSYDNAIYSGYDSSIISVVDGTITAISKGTTTITVSFEHVPLTETISVTVLSNKIESNTYEVRAATSGRDRIVIGSELLTTIGAFKNNLLNPNQYINVYDSNNNLINDSEIVMTGQVIKLVYGQTDMDEAIMVVRGDINGDGYVNVMDQIILTNSTAGVAPINPSTEYPKFAAADVEEDEFINRLDEVKMMNFVIDSIDSLNN